MARTETQTKSKKIGLRNPMTEDKIKNLCYTKEEVDKMIADAVAEARSIDEASMRKHNRDATVISMILGFTTLALFIDGLLRMLGIIPPFMDLDVNIIDDIANKTKVIVENDLVQAGLNKIPKLLK